MVRGTTFSFARISRPAPCEQPRDLTGAKIYVTIRADMKCDPAVLLTSESPPEAGYRTGVVISDQVARRGEFVVTLIPSDTATLIALGHDDPWFYEIKIVLADGSVIEEIAPSNLDLYPEVGSVPSP